MDPASLHVRLIEQADSLITPFDRSLRTYAYRQLQQRGVDVRTGTSISAVSHGSVTLADGTALASDITMWAAGVAAPDLVKDLGLEQGRTACWPPARTCGSTVRTGSSRPATSR